MVKRGAVGYGLCPQCGADGELEGTMDTVDHAQRPAWPGDPVRLRELMVCPACKHHWWETWAYVGQEQRA